MGVLSMGPTGAALGTTISQAVSVVSALAVILKKDTGIKVKKGDFKPKKNVLGEILKIGIPVSLQDGFIQISFIIITIIANRRGLNDAAAVGIVEKVIGILFLIPSSMSSSVSALAAQNIGAKKFGRARSTMKYAIYIAVGFGIVVAVTTQFFSEQIVGIFGKDREVMVLGGQYLRSYVWDCIFAGIHFCFSGYFCALGYSGISFMHNTLSIILARVPGAYFLSKMYPHTLFPMGLAAPAGSVISVIICVFAYIIINKKNILHNLGDD